MTIAKEFNIPEIEKVWNHRLSSAIAVATEAHLGQVDKAGLAYILHPLRVMEAVRPYGQLFQMVGVLHDVVEDTNVTLSTLVKLGFPAPVIDGVDAISRRKGESGKDYTERCCLSYIGTVVKIADIDDNIRPDRLWQSDYKKQEDYQQFLLHTRVRCVEAVDKFEAEMKNPCKDNEGCGYSE